jgi:adenine-specific DNA-methyltransferase
VQFDGQNFLVPAGLLGQPVVGKNVRPLLDRVSEENFWKLVADNRVWWGKQGDSIPQIKRFLSEVKQGVTPQTFWPYEEVGHTQEAKQEILALFGQDVFLTPKPERLMNRIIQVGSKPGDLVLDSFLGSGTTAAVAQKMGRRYIGIEMGEHAITHCAPRLQKVIGGEQGGISESMNWKGGGGFRFYQLGEPAFDAEGRIRNGIKFPILAAHVWFSETGTPWNGKGKSPLLGFHGEQAYAMLYNGILGDKTPKGGNVLTRETLAVIRERIAKKRENFTGALTIYGEATSLSDTTLSRQGIGFKQTPYDVKARK